MARKPWTAETVARRLQIADPPKSAVPCDRDSRHVGGIRFDLVRYGRVLGSVSLCGPCFLAINPPRDPAQLAETAA